MNPVLTSMPVLVLYPHNRCNCRCVMCDIWKIDTAQEISAVDLERHLDDLRALHVEWVVFSGGEPLMHSDLFRLADLLRANGIRTTLLSTGLLLRRYAARGVEMVVVEGRVRLGAMLPHLLEVRGRGRVKVDANVRALYRAAAKYLGEPLRLAGKEVRP